MARASKSFFDTCSARRTPVESILRTALLCAVHRSLRFDQSRSQSALQSSAPHQPKAGVGSNGQDFVVAAVQLCLAAIRDRTWSSAPWGNWGFLRPVTRLVDPD